MKRVVQWYVSDIKYPWEEDRHLSNYFPWNDLEHTDVKQVCKNLIKNKHVNDHIGRYSFMRDPDYHTWEKYDKETVIRFIDTDSELYNDAEYNVFPIRFRGNDDQIFTYKNLCPLGVLPKSTINWLRDHSSCKVFLHDVHEAKRITNTDFVTIPGITVKRKEFDLENNFIYLDSHTDSKYLTEDSRHVIPEWLQLASCSHWLQFVTFTKQKEFLDRVISYSNRKPLFKKGRFLCYAGRFRPARYLYLNKLLNEVTPKQLWLKAAYPDYVNNPLDQVNEVCNYFNYVNEINQLENSYDPSHRAIMTNFFKRLPINTFPEGIQEEDINYHKLDWFWLPNPAHYSRAFIDISCETYNERQGPYYKDNFITEKICKPMLAKRPFMCSSNPGLYDSLKDLGFKTFDKWWDESFAYEPDVHIHLDKLVKEIVKIDNLSNSECQRMWLDMRDTLQHNQDLMIYYADKAPRFWISEVKKIFNS